MKKVFILLLGTLIYINSFAGSYRIKLDQIYTINKNDLETVIQTVTHNDREAFEKAVKILIATKTGGFLPIGKEVIIVDREIGIVQFRFKGDLTKYWTIQEAIEYVK